MKDTAQTPDIAKFSATPGRTSILVIGAAVVALSATVAAAAWQVAVPMVGTVCGIVSALA